MDFTKAILYDWLCLVYFFAIMYPTGSINNIYIDVFMLMYCIWFFFIFQTIVFSSQSYCQQQLCSSILNLQENLKGAQVISSVYSSFFGMILGRFSHTFFRLTWQVSQFQTFLYPWSFWFVPMPQFVLQSGKIWVNLHK